MGRRMDKTLANGCLGKVQHRSALSAKYALDNMPNKDRHLLNYYKCQHCGCWHLGRTIDPFGENGIYKSAI